MRKLLLLTVILLTGTVLFAQVQRNVVIQEIGTGTWCTYCPGAANGAQQLLNGGANVAIIEYHNGDAFTNDASNARNSYYGITGYPTANFDGAGTAVGGAACPSGNVYGTYLPLYNTAYAVQSPLVIDISGTNTGNVYNIVLSIKKVSAISGSDLKAHLVLTETNIATAPWPGGGGCMTSVHDVERLMVPNQNGTDISFASGDMQIITMTFTKDNAWVLNNCELVAFVQDNASRTIFNGSKVALNALPAPVSVDFSGTPLAGCAPVTVNFSDLSAGVTNWQWTCTGGTPASPTVQNPAVSYTVAGSFDVTLVAWNNTTNRGNKKVRTAYVTPSASPVQPAQPSGTAQMCADPPDNAYSIATVPGATSYVWDLSPATAGTLTPSGTNCTVNWSSTFTGTATLKVKGNNSCGDSPWSPALTITLSTPPGTPGTPAGATTVCINSANSSYTTSGTTPTTAYFWEILPSSAGTVTGTSTTAIVDWSPSFTGTATLKVKGINGGCDGPWSSNLDITVDGGPGVYPITGGGIYCATSATGLPVGLSGSQSGINYTLYKNGLATSVVIAGTGSSISFGDQPAGTYTVVGQNAATCTSSMDGSAVITSDPQAPEAPATPQGPATPNAGTSSEYSTTGGLYATTYTWTVTPSEAGDFTGNTATGSIEWNSNYTGPAQITVAGINSCGNGTVSAEFPVTVLPAVGIASIKGKTFAKLTPNPAKGQITLKAGKGNYTVKVSNFLGQEVMNLRELSANSVIDINRLSSGIYFFTIDNGTAVQVIRVVVE